MRNNEQPKAAPHFLFTIFIFEIKLHTIQHIFVTSTELYLPTITVFTSSTKTISSLASVVFVTKKTMRKSFNADPQMTSNEARLLS